MVRTCPMRAAIRAETSCEKAASRFTAKKIAPTSLTGTAKRRKSQSATMDWIANPPPKESSENNAASSSTTRRDRARGAAWPAGGGSTAGESLR